MADNSSNNKRLAKNTMFLYFRLFFVLIVSLYTSRVVLAALGVEDFGVYNVIAGFVSLFGFFNSTLTSSVQRYYNFEGTRDGVVGFQRVYITGVIIQLILAAFVFIVLESFGIWYVNNVMVLDEERLVAANWVFQSAILSLILVLFQIPYAGAIMAKERMDYYAFVSIIDVVLRLIIVIVLQSLPYDKLITYSILTMCISIFNFAMYYFYSKYKFMELNFRFVYHKELFHSMLAFSGWNLVGTFAFMLKGQGLNVLLNAFFGPIVNAARAIAFQVNSAIASFSSNITVAFRPQIVNSYADNNHSRTCRLMFTETKVCFVLIGCLVTPVIIEMDYILKFWLGDNIPDNTAIFAILALIDLLIGTLNTPCTQVVMAIGKIKRYQIASTTVNILLLPCCWFLLKIGLDATSVFIATIAFSIINQIVCLYFTNELLPFGIKEYVKEVLNPCVLFAALLPIMPFLTSKVLEPSFLQLIFVGIVDVVCVCMLLFLVVLDANEKKQLSNLLLKNKNKYFPNA